jgi:acetyltransferase-like isoleucine patch superfamily enzyme
MKAYMIGSTKKLEPFGDHPGNCLIANRKLSEIQKQVLQTLGLELRTIPDAALIEDPDEHIILGDSLFYTKELMKQFIDKSRRLRSCTTCALKPGLVTLHTIVPTQDIKIHTDRVEYDLHYVPAQRLPGNPVPIVINPEQFSQLVPIPEHIRGAQQYRIPMTDTFLIQVDHWTNLWAANIAHLLADVARLMKASKIKLLGLALKARSLNKWRIFHQVNKIGKNCDIHPTAYIEGSTIGDNVMIGAGAVIRLSVIGDGTSTGSNVTIESSVIGEECSIDSDCGAFGSVLYPRTTSSCRLIFTSLCGRDTFLADGCGLSDFRIDGKNVTVMKAGMSINTGVLALGSCLGHGAYLSAGCLIAPGIAIPNGLRLLPEKSLIISEVNPDGTIPGHRLVTDLTTGHSFSRSRKGSRTRADNP